MNNEFGFELHTGAGEFLPYTLCSDPELWCVLDGDLQVRCPEQTHCLGRDDILVVNQGSSFSCISDKKKTVALRITLPIRLLTAQLGDVPFFIDCDSAERPDDDYEELRAIIKTAVHHYLTVGRIDFFLTANMYRILYSLLENYLVTDGDVRFERYNDQDVQRRMKIIMWLENHYDEDVSLTDLSDYLHLASAYLSRLLKKLFDNGFSELLTQVRLRHVVKELEGSQKQITAIAMDCGFASMVTFYRVFKKAYGVSPTEYKAILEEKSAGEQYKQEAEETDRALLVPLRKRLSTEGNTDIPKNGRVINECIESTAAGLLLPVWNRLANIGKISNIRENRIREEIQRVSGEISMEYARFWNVLSDEMHLGKCLGEDPLSYDYSRLDDCLDFLLQNHIKPFFHLGYVNPDGEDAPDRRFSDAFRFRSLDEMEQAVTALLRHLLMRYGDAVNEWIFGLWYPNFYVKLPDFFREKESAGYSIRMYRVIRREAPGVKIAAADFSLLFEKDSVRQKIRLLQKEGVKPDLVTCVSYPYRFEQTDKGKLRSWQAYDSFMRDELQSFRNTLRAEGWGELPLWVTEYNFTLGQRDLLNDSRFRGAYILKNMIDAVRRTDACGYYLLSDLYAEGVDTNSWLFGGCGIVTKDGINKPSFFALCFLSILKQQYVASGPNYMVTTDGKSGYAIVVHNMKSLSATTLMKPSDSITEEELTQIFEDMEPLNLTITLRALQDGRYRIKRHLVDEKHGDLRSWFIDNPVKVLSRQEIGYLKQTVMPEMTIRIAQAENGRLEVPISLGANCFAAFEIQRVNY